MSFQRSFRKILNEKMQEASVAPPFSSVNSQVYQTDPAHLAFLMGHVSKHSFTSAKATRSYPRPAPRPRPAHVLNTSQLLSLEYLKSFDGSLSESFSFQELKAVFRLAALRTHPDQGGSVQVFMELKTHYQSLLAVVRPAASK